MTATTAEARPSPFAGLPTHHRTVVGAAFDLLTKAAPDIRSASLYAGLIVLLTCAPLAILLWRLLAVLTDAGVDIFSLDPGFGPATGPPIPFETASAIENSLGWLLLALIVGGAGLSAAAIDSRAMMATLLAARLAGVRISQRDALRRARASFWAIAGAVFLVSIPTGIGQTVLAELFRGRASELLDFADVAAALVVAMLAAPFAYILAGVVLGAVGPIVTLGRSVTLFRARKGAGLVVALFAFAGQFIVLGGLFAGADLVIRVFEALNVEAIGPTAGTVLAIVVILVFVFSIGSLTATVSALEIAPQVLMFVALTHVAPGLETLDGRQGRPSLVPPLMIVVVAVGILALIFGLGALWGI